MNCSFGDCQKKVKASGLCSTHYERKRTGKQMDLPIRDVMPNGLPQDLIGNNGYVYVSIGGKKRLKHRLIMEEHLGRKLKRREVIHHIDGNPLNNDIRNLIITTQSEHMSKHHKKNIGECSVKGCERQVRQCLLCAGHYKRLYRRGDTFPEIPIGVHPSVFRSMALEIVEKKRLLGEWEDIHCAKPLK